MSLLPLAVCEDCNVSDFDAGRVAGRTWAMCNACGHNSYTVRDRQSGKIVEARTLDKDVGMAMVADALGVDSITLGRDGVVLTGDVDVLVEAGS